MAMLHGAPPTFYTDLNGLFCKKQDELFFPLIQTSRSDMALATNPSVKPRPQEVSISRRCAYALLENIQVMAEVWL
jgi:hypothetical protein